MELVQDDELYERAASRLQCVEISLLNDALKTCGVADAAKRREICDAYFMAQGDLLDTHYLKEKKELLYPVIAFARKPLQAECSLEEPGPVYLPGGGFEFHGYAPASVGYFFDENKENLPGVETGPFYELEE